MSLKRLWLGSLMGLMVVVATAAAQDAPETTTAAENKTETTTTRPPLTGNPQIDYKYDPNLPHELLGYDLSDYPFYARLPPDLLDPKFNFSCDDRHDGFYASVPHKCQVYHNCLFGQRYDFLCANYTVFDQKNFICHYVSEVDCINSANHYDRNDELYETTTTTTTTPPPPQIIYVERPRPLANRVRPNLNRPRPSGPRPGKRPGKRRPSTTTPAPTYDYDYYYDQYYDQYYDDYYNDYASERTTTTTTTTTQRPRRPLRPQRTRLGNRNNVEDRSRPSGRFGGVFSVRDRQRPRINPPVPQDAGEDDFRPRASRLQQDGPQRRQNLNNDEPPQGPRREQGSGPRRRRPRPNKKPTTTTTTTTTEAAPDYYYDDYYEYYDDEETSTTTTTTTAAPARQSRPRPGGSRGRPRRPETTTSSTTTTTATEEPFPQEPSGGRDSRPGRVNIRKNPLVGRRPIPTPVEQEPPAEPQEAAGGPQRRRPSFPRRRQQSEPEVVLEDAPLAPGIGAEPEEDFVDFSANNAPSGEARRRQRRPIRRGSGVRGGGAPQSSGPDYYDY